MTKVVLTVNRDRRSNNSAKAGDRTDANIGSRIKEFHDLLSQKNYYRIPLKFFTNLGLVNLVHNTNTKFLFTLESNLNKLFESNAKVDHIPANPDAKIIYHDTPYIYYQQIVLDDNFQAFQNASLRSKTALRTGIFNAPYQQSFELNVGTQSRKINFYGAASQFEFLEISLVYDKSDQHQTIYDSYDVELAAKTIQSLTIENASSTYSLTGIRELNINNEDDKHQLYSMFIAYNCDGCSAAPLTQYRNNEIYQEITKEADYFKDTSDEKLYIDMRRSKGYTDELEKLTRDDSDVNLTVKLKAATTKKLRLKVIAYSQAEYFYTTSSQGQIMTFKSYNVTKESNTAA